MLPLFLGYVAIELHASTGILARLLVSLAVRTLPGRNRARYREEWLAELEPQSGAAALLWAGSVLFTAPKLTVVLRRTSAKAADVDQVAKVQLRLGADLTIDRVVIAYCCAPTTRDPIVVYVAKAGTKASVHRRDCVQLLLSLPQARQYEAFWSAHGLPATVRLSASREVSPLGTGIAWLEEIAGAFRGLGISARLVRANGRSNVATAEFIVEWPGERLIDAAVDSLMGLPGMRRVQTPGRATPRPQRPKQARGPDPGDR